MAEIWETQEFQTVKERQEWKKKGTKKQEGLKKSEKWLPVMAIFE